MRKLTFILFVILTSLSAGSARSQQIETFSYSKNPLAASYTPYSQKMRITAGYDKFFNTPVVQMAGIPMIFFGISAATYNSGDKYLRDVRNKRLSGFSENFDDYLQYAPGVAVFAMKAAGVESRSSWPQLLTSSAISTGLNIATVQIVKGITLKQRPDDSNMHSFPSGHTAFAFLTATWMYMEYGHKSILYPIAGYSVATLTGFGRYINNRHWISDIVAGAGVGILAANVGYYVTGLLFRTPSFYGSDICKLDIHHNNPSFVAFNTGYSIFNNELKYQDPGTPTTRNGFFSSAEAAWYFTPNWGIGGEISVSSNSLKYNQNELFERFPELRSQIYDIKPYGLVVTSINPGGYYSHGIRRRTLFTAKLQPGISFVSSSMVEARRISDNGTFNLFRNNSLVRFNLNMGADFTFFIKENVGLKIFSEYNMTFRMPGYEIYSGGSADNPEMRKDHGYSKYIHSLYIGGAVSAYIF